MNLIGRGFDRASSSIYPLLARTGGIRPAETVCSLAWLCPRLLSGDYPPSTFVMALPLISRAQPALVTCGTYYVLEEESTLIVGALLGAGGWTAQAPGKGAITRGVGHICHVVTDDRATRRGVGRALLTHICADAKTTGLRRLHCLSTLTAAPFYTAMGFETLGLFTIPLAAGIEFPAIEMERQLCLCLKISLGVVAQRLGASPLF